MFLWCCIVLVVLANNNIKAEISIDSDGGYKNIVIGISPNLNKSDVESIIFKLRTLFRETSEALLTASEKNVFFKDIVFALPKEYETWISKSNFQVDGHDSESFRKPDLYLTDDDVFDRPYALQHQGCGYPGLRINIPSEFLVSKADVKALALVRGWTHYRYGVFSENGFPNDEIYPDCYRIPGSDDVRRNDCTNENAVYEIDERDLNDDTASTCRLVPVYGKNDHIVSSIMTNIDFPQMRYFCNDESRPHNRNSPNKQNALCREKSTWEVISASEDFIIKKSDFKLGKKIKCHNSNCGQKLPYNQSGVWPGIIVEKSPGALRDVRRANATDPLKNIGVGNSIQCGTLREEFFVNETIRVKECENKNTSNVKPAFKYFVESDPNFVFAVDTSSEMDSNNRMTMVLNAFTYFMFYDLPSNSTVRLVDMRSKESDVIEKTVLNEEDASWLVGLFPETDAEGESCVHCTIQRLLEVMKLNIRDIIVITATDITKSWIDNITAMLKSNKVALHVIYFQKILRYPAFLERVAKDSGGSFFYIPESFPPGFPVSSITLLYEAFRSIYESFSWMNRQHVLVDQMTFTNNCKPKCMLSFPSDRTIQTLQVILTGTEFGRNSPVLRKSIILENGIQQFLSGNDSFVYKSEVPAYIITVQNPQEGKWNLTFERKPGFNTPVVVIVRATNKNYGDIINMQSWTSRMKKKNIDHSDRPPIAVYSEIKKHNRAVIDVEVTALLHQATYNTNSSLELRDVGDGDPDITRNDGIYSRYLTGITDSGYYSLTVVAEKKVLKYYRPVIGETKGSRCCGSSIPDHLSYESGYFRRVATYQSFYVGEENEGITYPPRRVADLRIDRIEILSKNVKCYILKWTAPGDNYDKGTALSYDIKVFKTREAALEDFQNNHVLSIKMLNIQGPLLEPQEAGTVQTAYVELTNLTSGTYFMALKTTSHSGKTSDVSNVVELTYTDQNPLVTGFSKDVTSAIGGTTEIIPGNDSEETNSAKLELAIGLSCGILLLLFIIGCILFVCLGRIKKSKKKPKAAIYQNTKKTESSDALCHSNGGGNISIISPVTSWDANSLVSRYETLQQRKTTEANGIVTIPENLESDNVSLPSTKYSYDKMEQNSPIYDPIYYHQVRSQDELNYPYNPGYTPFDPRYTSSMRNLDDSNMINNPYCSDNASFCSYSLPRHQTSRLKTDV